eukprot:GEZU01014903.1.p1 GENE.GEZU01014903.1~~GEZU01014903.1.p1  ORF type:complete len:859 (+),score=147.74 GEZU01014903.1:254-2830(+)
MIRNLFLKPITSQSDAEAQIDRLRREVESERHKRSQLELEIKRLKSAVAASNQQQQQQRPTTSRRTNIQERFMSPRGIRYHGGSSTNRDYTTASSLSSLIETALSHASSNAQLSSSSPTLTTFLRQQPQQGRSSSHAVEPPPLLKRIKTIKLQHPATVFDFLLGDPSLIVYDQQQQQQTSFVFHNTYTGSVQEIFSIPSGDADTTGTRIMDMRYSPAHKMIIVAASDKSIRLLRVSTNANTSNNNEPTTTTTAPTNVTVRQVKVQYMDKVPYSCAFIEYRRNNTSALLPAVPVSPSTPRASTINNPNVVVVWFCVGYDDGSICLFEYSNIINKNDNDRNDMPTTITGMGTGIPNGAMQIRRLAVGLPPSVSPAAAAASHRNFSYNFILQQQQQQDDSNNINNIRVPITSVVPIALDSGSGDCGFFGFDGIITNGGPTGVLIWQPRWRENEAMMALIPGGGDGGGPLQEIQITPTPLSVLEQLQTTIGSNDKSYRCYSACFDPVSRKILVSIVLTNSSSGASSSSPSPTQPPPPPQWRHIVFKLSPNQLAAINTNGQQQQSSSSIASRRGFSVPFSSSRSTPPLVPQRVFSTPSASDLDAAGSSSLPSSSMTNHFVAASLPVTMDLISPTSTASAMATTTSLLGSSSGGGAGNSGDIQEDGELETTSSTPTLDTEIIDIDLDNDEDNSNGTSPPPSASSPVPSSRNSTGTTTTDVSKKTAAASRALIFSLTSKPPTSRIRTTDSARIRSESGVDAADAGENEEIMLDDEDDDVVFAGTRGPVMTTKTYIAYVDANRTDQMVTIVDAVTGTIVQKLSRTSVRITDIRYLSQQQPYMPAHLGVLSNEKILLFKSDTNTNNE